MLFTLRHVAGLDRSIADGTYPDLDVDLVQTVLEEAGKFAAGRIAPLNRVGDGKGTPFAGGKVTMPDGWRETYAAWAEGGWNALPAAAEHGGQGCRRSSTRPASRCGTPPRSPSRSGRC